VKYAPRKVFILENGEYIEISYEELCRREGTDPSYRDKLFIPLHGMIMEVTQEQYDDFYRTQERQRYLKKCDRKYGLLSLDAFDTETDKGTDYLCVSTEDVAETVAHLLLLDRLRKVIAGLPEDEKALIKAHFYDGTSQTALAEEYGVNQSNISRRIARILEKVKKFLEI